MINETAKNLIDEYAETQSIGWSSCICGDIQGYLECGIMKSPIEQIFYAVWSYGCQSKDDASLIPQVKVGKFFIDFEVDFIGHFINHEYPFSSKQFEVIKKEIPKIAIELDGHEWHEKTKEQVEKDKQRERFIVSQGFKVYRFSGREVFKKPLDCVSEVREQVRPLIRNLKKKIWSWPNGLD